MTAHQCGTVHYRLVCMRIAPSLMGKQDPQKYYKAVCTCCNRRGTVCNTEQQALMTWLNDEIIYDENEHGLVVVSKKGWGQ